VGFVLQGTGLFVSSIGKMSFTVEARSDKKQSELNIINLRTSFCQKADSTMDPPSKGLLVDQIRKGGSIVGDGTIEVEVWEHRISVWSFNGKLTLLARTKAIELRMA